MVQVNILIHTTKVNVSRAEVKHIEKLRKQYKDEDSSATLTTKSSKDSCNVDLVDSLCIQKGDLDENKALMVKDLSIEENQNEIQDKMAASLDPLTLKTDESNGNDVDSNLPCPEGWFSGITDVYFFDYAG